MKTIALFLLILTIGFGARASDSIEKPWFPYIDGVFTKAEFIDLNTNLTERLYIRYGPISDSGVELERTTNNIVVWRTHVQPLGVAHSKYTHEVRIRIIDDQVRVTSTGFQVIDEVHSLKTGALVSRKVSELPK